MVVQPTLQIDMNFEKMPKFTVSIPAFKGNYLHEAIASVLAQTIDDWELVVVDDCSPEDLASIVASFDDARIRYYRNERNFGAEHVVGNWNMCLKYAHGDFIICMGDDDRLLPNCLEDLAALTEKYPNLDVFYSRTQLIDEHSDVLETFPSRPQRESVYEMIWRRWNGGSMFIGDYCYRVSVLRARGGFYDLPFAWGSDAISAYELAKKNGIANTSVTGFQYRVNRHSISSHTDNTDGKIRALKLARKWFDDFFKEIPKEEQDLKILASLRRMKHSHFVHMLSADIIHGVMCNPIQQMKYWIANRKDTGLSRWELLKCVIHGLIRK